MVLAYILFPVVLIWLFGASIVDLHKREVPDWLSYSLICFGLGSRLIYSLMFENYSAIIYGILGLLFGFIFGMFMYFTRQWGGGDGKLLMGLGVVSGDFKFMVLGFEVHFLLALLVSIFIIGGLYSILYSLVLAFKNKNAFLNKFLNFKKYELLVVFLFGVLFILTSWLLFFDIWRIVGFVCSILFVVLYFIFKFVRAVESSCMHKMVSVNKLVEGDWLSKDIKSNGKVICSSKGLGLNKKDISKIKKLKIKNVLVKEGIPFVPSFLVAFILVVWYSGILF